MWTILLWKMRDSNIPYLVICYWVHFCCPAWAHWPFTGSPQVPLRALRPGSNPRSATLLRTPLGKLTKLSGFRFLRYKRGNDSPTAQSLVQLVRTAITLRNKYVRLKIKHWRTNQRLYLASSFPKMPFEHQLSAESPEDTTSLISPMKKHPPQKTAVWAESPSPWVGPRFSLLHSASGTCCCRQPSRKRW